MHATIEQLITYRDQALLDAEIKMHIRQCDVCLHELAVLKSMQREMQALPVKELDATDFASSWKVIEESLSEEVTNKKVIKPYWIAVAASVVSVAFLLMYSNTNQIKSPVQSAKSVIAPDNKLSPNNEGQVLDIAPVQTNRPTSLNSELIDLHAYSRVLENRLQAMPQPRVVRANTAETISQLQDQISILDNRLNLDYQNPLTELQRTALWQQRVNSMNNLYRVRTAQLQRVTY